MLHEEHFESVCGKVRLGIVSGHVFPVSPDPRLFLYGHIDALWTEVALAFENNHSSIKTKHRKNNKPLTKRTLVGGLSVTVNEGEGYEGTWC